MAEQHDDDVLGAMELVALELPDGRIGSGGLAALLDLVDRRTIRVLDLEFVARRADDTVAVVDVSELTGDVDLSALAGASSGLLDQTDIDGIGAMIAPGSVAAILVYEELGLVTLVNAWERDGARVVAQCPVLPDELLGALDATGA